jgi:hypothetical protein
MASDQSSNSFVVVKNKNMGIGLLMSIFVVGAGILAYGRFVGRYGFKKLSTAGIWCVITVLVVATWRLAQFQEIAHDNLADQQDCSGVAPE